MPHLSAIPDALRARIVQQIQNMFNDRDKGDRPVLRSTNALYSPDSVIWRVHGDVTTMMIGGIAALLLQMLHPLALAGVWDHSRFRDDMLGRLRRTARFIAMTTYGERADAENAIARVRDVHTHISGRTPDGVGYAASDPHLLAWVHVCEAVAFLDAWVAFGEPSMSRADQDRYFAEAAVVARMLGAGPVPESRAEAEALIKAFRSELVVNDRTRKVAHLILHPPASSPLMVPTQRLLTQASVEILPKWARDMHALERHTLARPVVRGGAFSLATTVRWAFGQRLRFPGR